MIPKIIHNTYKNHNLPKQLGACQQQTKLLHPDFDYRFYTDEDIYDLIEEDFPEYYQKFCELPRMIMKLDMFRYFLMYRHGGIYADMDYYWLRQFDLLDYEVVIPCNRELPDGKPSCLGNCLFASRPGHPFWKTLMDTLFTVDRLKTEYKIDDTIIWHEHGTACGFVYSMWKKYEDSDTIHIPARGMFHPPMRVDKDHMEQLKSEGVYGMHLCTGLWLNNKL